MDTHGTFSIPSIAIERLQEYGGEKAVMEYMNLQMVVGFGANILKMIETEIEPAKNGDLVVTWAFDKGTVN